MDYFSIEVCINNEMLIRKFAFDPNTIVSDKLNLNEHIEDMVKTLKESHAYTYKDSNIIN